jgi:TMEM175 potassium channel family protein
MDDPEDREIESGEEIERTIFFSDAVFAIAITLLALNLEVPDIPADLVATELPQRLLELWSKFYSFFLSFWIIGNYWLIHHRIFNHIRGYDRVLLLINLLFLMWIVLLPFSSSLLGEYGNEQLPAIFYASHMIAAGLTLSWLRRHAYNSRLVVPDIDPLLVRYENIRAMVIPSVFLLSIGVSFVSVRATEYGWLLLFLARPALLRYAKRGRRPPA